LRDGDPARFGGLGVRRAVGHVNGQIAETLTADLAVGAGCGQIKSEAPARGERTAKYNRLLEIEAGLRLPFGLCA